MSITFNGKTYNSIEEMPPDVRQAYEQVMGVFADKNRNGMPDLFENLQAGKLQQTFTSTNIVYEGKVYQSADELPAEARAKYENAMRKLDKDRNGVPDVVEGKGGGKTVTSFKVSSRSTLTPSAPITPSVINPDQSNTRLLVSAGIVIALLACAVIMLLGYIYLR